MKVILVVVLLLTLLMGTACAQPFVTGLYEPLDSGYRLHFTVTAGEFVVGSWFLTTSSALDAIAPEGWMVTVMDRDVQWGTNSSYYRIQPGNTLSGFSTTVSELSAEYNYFVSQLGSTGYSSTLTPTLIPEPSSLIAVAAGLPILGLPFVRRRVRNSRRG